MNLQAIFKELTPRARIGLGAAALGVVLVLFFLLKLATAPSYVTVTSGIKPAESDKITTALADRGVSYELRDAGSSVAVEKSQLAEARIALATSGVTSATGDKPGFELLDQQKLGASDFQQRVTYQRALEGEIAQTVGAIDGVGGAEVQLTLPEDKLFSSEATPATAAVLLAGGTALDAGQVRGIASLVSSSVSGLKSDNVTITDGNGQMLWPNGDSGSGSGASKIAAQAKYATQMESRINNMLARTLGPDAARVQVAADLNMDQSSKEELAYAAKGTPLEANEDKETLAGTTPGGGTAGTAANIDGSTAAAAAGGSNYDHTVKKTTYGVGKTVTKTKVAPGSVNKMQIAVMVNEKNGAPLTPDVESMVSAAAGLDPARGDVISTTRFKFASTPTAKTPLPITPTGVLGMLKYILAGLAALVFLFLASRNLRRRESTDLAEPRWLSEIEQPRPLSELVAALEAGEQSGAGNEQGALAAGSSRDQLAAVASQDPERLARQLRQWMTEDQPS